MASLLTWTTVESPTGSLLLTSDGRALTGLYPQTHRARPQPGPGWVRDDSFFSGVRDQLALYFAGRLERFEVALSLKGTDFQCEVWEQLNEIPFGGTWTYGELAARIGRPSSSRAVGIAAGKNPISVIVPCHRLVGAHGALTGYAGGLPMKAFLLHHEQHPAPALRVNTQAVAAFV